jgi:hypothetical protein
MMISAELQKLLKTWLITYLGSHLLFIRGDARAENSRICMEHRSRAPCFLYAAMRVLKVVEYVWSVDREPLTFYTRCCVCKKYKMIRNINQEVLTDLYVALHM